MTELVSTQHVPLLNNVHVHTARIPRLENLNFTKVKIFENNRGISAYFVSAVITFHSKVL